MIAKEIDREGIPVVHITAITMVSKQTGANRIVAGVKVVHPCGNAEISAENDRTIRKEIIQCALRALQTDIDEPTVFMPNIWRAGG